MLDYLLQKQIEELQAKMAAMEERICKLEPKPVDPTIAAYLKGCQNFGNDNSKIQARNELTPGFHEAKGNFMGDQQALNAHYRERVMQDRNDNAPQGGFNARNDPWSAYAAQGIQDQQSFANFYGRTEGNPPIPVNQPAPGFYRISILGGYADYPDRRVNQTDRRKS